MEPAPKGKGIGKKGEGSKANVKGGAPFTGESNHCGEKGHPARECPKGKGKGKGEGFKGKGKGAWGWGKGVWAVDGDGTGDWSWQQPEEEKPEGSIGSVEKFKETTNIDEDGYETVRRPRQRTIGQFIMPEIFAVDFEKKRKEENNCQGREGHQVRAQG